jgi:hypothetical protein
MQWFTDSDDDFVTDFVSSPGNRYTTMHYDIMRVHTRMSFQHLYSAR